MCYYDAYSSINARVGSACKVVVESSEDFDQCRQSSRTIQGQWRDGGVGQY